MGLNEGQVETNTKPVWVGESVIEGRGLGAFTTAQYSHEAGRPQMQRKQTLPIDKAYEADWVSQGNVGALDVIIKNLVFAYLMEETKERS